MKYPFITAQLLTVDASTPAVEFRMKSQVAAKVFCMQMKSFLSQLS